MLRLYIRFYITLLASLMIFGLAAALFSHMAAGPLEHADVTIGRLLQNVLPPAQAPDSAQQEALQKLTSGMHADVTLFAADGRVVASIGHPLLMPPPRIDRLVSFSQQHGSTVSSVRLADGRLLVASVPISLGSARFNFHLLLVFAAVSIGLAAFPVVRYLSRRLERLQAGVDSLGSGDLGARVAVEGDDEVARLAKSFNRAAGRIEQLVRAHQSLLANASHELRTPLARIRLALEMLKQSADAKTKAGLEQDIAELDQLVEEILLASRLSAVEQNEVREEIDLLALAAEECARYDDVHLEGLPVKIQGDARLLRRLLRNLLENAKRHGAPPTQVRLARDPAAAVLKVWDHGPGPARAEFEQVFTPFYRRRDGSSTGNGLGLSLVRQIARRHGGDARCEVMDEGRNGFVITLGLGG